MAIAIAGTPAETAVTTAGTSHAVTLPAGGASTDLYLLIGSIGSTAATLNALTDWTELLDENAAIGLKILIYTGAGVPSNPTFTSSGSTRSAWIAYRLTGVDKTITPQIGTTGTGTSLTPDPPSVTPTGGISKPYLFIAFAGMAGEEADDDTWGNTPPTNYTPNPPRQKACGTVGTNLGGLILAAERALTTGSAEDPGTFNVDVSAAWRSQTIIVHPLFSGTAAASNTTPRATATGAKGGTSTATETTTTPRAVATGAKQAAGAATASNTTPRATATGGKNFASAATASNTTPQATATGAKGGQSAATESAAARTTATGQKAGFSVSGGVERVRAFDNFEDGTVDAFWGNPSVGVSESGGNGVIPFTNGVSNRFRTTVVHQVRDRSFVVEIVRDNSGTASTTISFSVGDGSANRVTFSRTGSSAASFVIRQAAVNVVDLSVAYNATTMRWIRIRESAGVLFLETSPDGLVWTVRASARRTWSDSLAASVDIGNQSVTASNPAAMLIDNFSITQSTEVSAAAQTVGSGAKQASGTASSSASQRTIGTGAKGGTAGATASNVPRAESSGTKDGTGSATASNTTPRVVATGTASVAESHTGSATVSAAALASATGTKAAASGASCSAAVLAAATGEKAFVSAATSTTRPTATATGLKGGQSAAACSAQAQCAATGAEGGQALITASLRATATATGLKGGQSAVTCSAQVQAQATGAEGGQQLITVSARPTATATGTKAGQGAATVSAKARATATIADRFDDEASASARATCSSSGVKGGQGAAASSARSATTAAGAKNAAGAGTVSAAATAATVSGRSVSGSAAAAAAARSVVSGEKGGRSAVSATETSEASASGEKVGAAAASASARGHTTAVGIRTASGATTATARASATASGAKNATGDASASAAAVVTGTALVVVVGDAAVSNTTPRATAAGGRTVTVTYGTILEGAGRGQVRSASDYSGVRALHPDPPTIVVD